MVNKNIISKKSCCGLWVYSGPSSPSFPLYRLPLRFLLLLALVDLINLPLPWGKYISNFKPLNLETVEMLKHMKK